MRASLPALLFMCTSGCAEPGIKALLSLPVAPSPEAQPVIHHQCPRSQLPFDQASERVQEGPAPIPGDDGGQVLLRLEDRSRRFEIVRWMVEVIGDRSPRVLFVQAPGQDTREVALSAGERSTLRLRAIVRPAEDRGLFQHLTICFDKWSTFSARADGEVMPIVIEDGDASLPPGSWDLFRVVSSEVSDVPHTSPPR